MKRIALYFLLPLCFLGLVAFTTTNNKYFEISKNIEIFANLYKEINTHYVDELDPGKLMKVGVDAMLGSLDPYTNYFSETQMEGFRYLSEGRFDGIGAEMKKIKDYITILETTEKSPAIEAGLKAGDQILEVNGESAKGKSQKDILNVFRGAPGTQLQLRIQRPGTPDPLDLTLTRGKVNARNVPYSGFVSDGIGYINLTTFTANAGRNVANALRDLKTDNPDMTGVVLDLRGNGGGLLREAINVSNVFIDKDEEVVSTKGKVADWDKYYKTRNEPVDKEIKVAVMINKSSASASEIVSGVMQDLDRGVLIGQRSYGKGLVQNTRDVGYNAKVKLTTSKYYIPSGRCIQSIQYEQGEHKDIPEADRTPFKTRNGREVRDGGGLKPDVYIEHAAEPTIIKRLKAQNHIFNFVTDYCLKHDDIGPVEDFSFNKFDEFLTYLKANDFKYETNSERRLNKLTEMIETEGMKDELVDALEGVKAKIEKEKSGHLSDYKDEILALIEADIIGRYYFEDGRIKQRLKNDAELNKAIEVLNDTETYNSILKG